MSFSEKFENTFRRLLPSPFSIAIGLTMLALLLSFFFTDFGQEKGFLEILNVWETSLWSPNLLAFAVQMMLMLVLGHVLALTPLVKKLIHQIVKYANNSANAAFLVSFSTILVGYLNWGLALIFGAILARSIAEHAQKNRIKINYPLIGACGYVGLMVWHGGISGSALVKVAEQGHLNNLLGSTTLPDSIPFNETIFSGMNIYVFLLSIILIPLLMLWLGKKSEGTIPNIHIIQENKEEDNQKHLGAERFDYSRYFSIIIAGALIGVAFIKAIYFNPKGGLSIITPNYINYCLLALGIAFHKNIHQFLKAVFDSIQDATGILIQFPLYFGIMGLMKETGLIEILSQNLVNLSQNLPLSANQSLSSLTFFSSGLVNIFVPSGGGQWAIQGPIIVKAAQELNVPLNKIILALAYGDELTNMLQPFWALPLLGITQLKAKDILPYTLVLLLIGTFIYLSALLLF